jgi:hypothetical protein
MELKDENPMFTVTGGTAYLRRSPASHHHGPLAAPI